MRPTAESNKPSKQQQAQESDERTRTAAQRLCEPPLGCNELVKQDLTSPT